MRQPQATMKTKEGMVRHPQATLKTKEGMVRHPQATMKTKEGMVRHPQATLKTDKGGYGASATGHNEDRQRRVWCVIHRPQ